MGAPDEARGCTSMEVGRTLDGDRDGREEEPLYGADLQLIRDALNRSAPHVDELLHRLRLVPRILRAQNARLGSPLNEHALDDLAQDVFVVIWRKLDRYDGRRPFEAWAYRICLYELMNGVRRQGRRTMAEVHPDVPDRQGEVSHGAYEEVHRGLETLPEPELAVVQLKHFEELTFEEVGQRLGISSNTAKTRYYRGMSRLEAFLRERRKRSEEDGEHERVRGLPQARGREGT